MKIKVITGIIMLVLGLSVKAQKLRIDTTALKNWSSVGIVAISDDGCYVLHTVDSLCYGDAFKRRLHIQSVDDHLHMAIEGIDVSSAKFTSDSKRIVFKKSRDSLGIVSLDNKNKGVEYYSDVESFRTYGIHLIYKKKSDSSLHINDFGSGRVTVFHQVDDYFLSEFGGQLVIKTGNKNETSLTGFNLVSGKKILIWKGEGFEDNRFDNKGGQLAFIINKNGAKEIWNHNFNSGETKLLVSAVEIAKHGLQVLEIKEFSGRGNRLYFRIGTELLRKKISPEHAGLPEIWNYNDDKLFPEIQLETESPQRYLSMVNIADGKILQLENDTTVVAIQGNDLVLLRERNSLIKNKIKNQNLLKYNCRVLFFDDGHELAVPRAGPISPNEKYLIYYDDKKGDYYTFELSSGNIYTITQRIKTNWTLFGNDHLDSASAVYSGRIKWTVNDNEVLLFDRNDIWMVDPKGKVPAKNITNGYGYRNGITFSHLWKKDGTTLKKGEFLYLTAFNRNNKDNGIFRIRIGETKDPEKLLMGNSNIYTPEILIMDGGDSPKKALNTEAYLVRRMSAKESPNYFFTRDFKNYKRISSVYPEKQYNWLSSELVDYQLTDGKLVKGILYKPENFDPKKKYPIILYYYEQLSDNLNVYIPPALSVGPINIPWFVSHEYLVFTPDIHYKMNEPGESALDAVESAVKYLSKFKFVDTLKMGIQGHSFGGFETNYIVTHSCRFAAASSAAGVSDLISLDGSIDLGGSGTHRHIYSGQFRFGATLWRNPEIYIKNSPVFRADKIVTPILLAHNIGDATVPFAQGVEFFTALRQLGKKVWLLQYDNEGHANRSTAASKDYTLRLTQFFDHYLKETPAPLWMNNDLTQ